MRVCLVKYTDVVDFKVEEPPLPWWCFDKRSADATSIEWKLPKLTEEEEAAVRDEMNGEFWASPIKEKVLEWRIEKRENFEYFEGTKWYFEIVCDRHHHGQELDVEVGADWDEENDDDEEDEVNEKMDEVDGEKDDVRGKKENDEDGSEEERDDGDSDEDNEDEDELEIENKECTVSFHFHDGYYSNCGRPKSGATTTNRVITKPANVEFLVQFGDSFIFFNDLEQTNRVGSPLVYERYTQYEKVVPVEVCKQLRNVAKDLITVTVFGVFEDVDVKQGLRMRPNRAQLTSPEFNWNIFLDQQRTDVTIVAEGGELIDCHLTYITRNSWVLCEMLNPPARKSFVVELLDLTRIQVEAFLRYQYSGTTDKILEAPVTSLGALKAAERFKILEVWTDTMNGLHQMDFDWFKGDAALELISFLAKCSKREEESTQKLIGKLSLVLNQQTQAMDSNSRNGDDGVTIEGKETDQVDENRETGDGESGLGCLKQETINEQPRATGQTAEVREQGVQNGENVENTMNSGTRRAKRSKVTDEDPDQLTRNKNSRVEVVPAPATVNRNLRRSPRFLAGNPKKGDLSTEDEPRKKALRVTITANEKKTVSQTRPKRRATTKRKPLRKRGLQTKDKSWSNAVQRDAENAKNAPKFGKLVYGPRDIRKDPVLPKVSIFPDPGVKVEIKVESLKEYSDDSPEIDAADFPDQVAQDQDFDEIMDDEPIPMDESSVEDADAAGYGVIKSSWSLKQTTDENV